jgi:hypothetical protein
MKSETNTAQMRKHMQAESRLGQPLTMSLPCHTSSKLNRHPLDDGLACRVLQILANAKSSTRAFRSRQADEIEAASAEDAGSVVIHQGANLHQLRKLRESPNWSRLDCIAIASLFWFRNRRLQRIRSLVADKTKIERSQPINDICQH